MSAPKSRWRRRGHVPARSDLDPTLFNPSAMEKVTIPKSDKVVIKTVPAKADGEVIGTAVIYEDGTMDIIANAEMSDKARAYLFSFQEMMLDGYDHDPLPES